jgi:hypothetical protein
MVNLPPDQSKFHGLRSIYPYPLGFQDYHTPYVQLHGAFTVEELRQMANWPDEASDGTSQSLHDQTQT